MSYSSNPVMDAERHSDAAEKWSASLDTARVFARQHVLGGDTDLMADLLSNFTAGLNNDKTPLLVPSPFLRGPMSTADVISTLLTVVSTDVLAAAARELRARYLADPYTQSAVEKMAQRFAEAL